MLNMGKLGVGQERYYLDTIAAGHEDYYTGSGEAPGYWFGGGLDDVGLEAGALVAAEQLRAVLGATDPATGSLLAKRTVPGWDLTFRAPKSVSILYGLATPEASEQVRDAHDAAVTEALSYLEQEAVRVRRGKGGVRRLATSGVVAALFRHRTSRAGDPQLHTHALVSNLGLGPDGKWGALYSPQLYQHAKAAGHVYQAALRKQLCARLEVEWGPVHHGSADLAGVPRLLIEVFSKRRAQIQERLAERGESSARAAQVATLLTRQPKKTDVSTATLYDRWRGEAAELGYGPELLDAVVGRARPHDPDKDELARVLERLAGPEGLTAHASTFTRRDVVMAWCDALPGGATASDVQDLVDATLSVPAGVAVALTPAREGVVDEQAATAAGADVIRREDGKVMLVDPQQIRYSTPELLATERAAIHAALSRVDERVGVAGVRTVSRALARRPSIAGEQAEMVRALTLSGRGVEILVGPAGTGKTFALDAAREAWQASGMTVLGTALAAKAAAELQAGAGIASGTVDRLLIDLDDPYGGLAPNTVVVVDEAAMVGTRKLARLLTAAQSAKAKVVLCGDHYQLPEIDAGGLFRGLVHRLPEPLELRENRRQRQAWEIAALAELRTGSVEDAVDAYQQHERVTLGETADEVRQRLVDDWWEQTAAGQNALIAALRRSDVEDLNRRARARHGEAGHLTGPVLEVEGRHFQAGDEILTLKNSRRLGVRNGDRWTITHIDTGAGAIQVEDGARSVTLPDFYVAEHVDYAYATTIHKAQGVTVDWMGALGSEVLYREAGYVALSRGRHANHLYVVTAEIDAEPTCESHGHKRPITDDTLSQVTKALERSREQALAADHVSATGPSPLGHVPSGLG